MLRQMQTDLLEKARKFRDANTFEVNSYDEFKKKIEEPGGFFWAHWDGTRETEDSIAAETKATIRCIPFDRPKETGKCMVTGQAVAGAGRVCQGVLNSTAHLDTDSLIFYSFSFGARRS